MPSNRTILDYYGAPEGSHCFYCPKYCSRYGMWAYHMAAADYQDLIDRGWRRLGQYFFKPNNPNTCCPAYTIRCDAKEFVFTKSHKKILKKMNSFLKTGQKGETENEDHSNGDNGLANGNSDKTGNSASDEKGQSQKNDVKSVGESSASAEIQMLTSRPRKAIDVVNVLKSIEQFEIDKEYTAVEVVSRAESNSNSSANSDNRFNESVVAESATRIVKAKPEKSFGSEATERKDAEIDGNGSAKPGQLKAKLLRQQRKKEKLEAKGITPDPTEVVKKTQGSAEKSLRSFIDEMPTDGKHKLKLKLINIDCDEFQHSKATEFELYARYQTRVHNDPPADMSEFNDFLCRSPIRHEKPDDGPECGYGTFHQQYWLDEILIAVGVIDILPRGLSSSYFFYDPDLPFLTLGTYGSLREIDFIQQMNGKCPEIRGYFIGYYIPSIPKMHYKAKLQPSYLLCPEKYTWHLLDDDLYQLLQQTPCKRFNLDPTAEVYDNFDPESDLKYLRLIVNNEQCMTHEEYEQSKFRVNGEKNCIEVQKLIEYAHEVGKSLSKRSYLVI